jgi:cell division protein FtsQ
MSSDTTVRPPARPAAAAKAEIDPRIAARRDEVERAHSRKVRRRFVVLLVVVGLVAAGVGLTRTPVLDVDEIQVAGNRVVSAAEVTVAAGVQHGDRMTGVDVGEVSERVEAMPWVRTASVSREWPSTVRIAVTARRPVAVVGGASGNRVVDDTGRVLGPARPSDAALVRLGGEPRAAPGERLGPRWRSMLAVAARLPGRLRPTVAAIGAGEDGTVVVLTTGTVVELCTPTDLDAKLGALLALVQRADPATAATIDLCVPGAPALTRKGRGA